MITILAIFILIAVVILASYISRVYSEYGKILTPEIQEILDAWEERVEPRLGLTRDHAALCSLVLKQITLGLIALAVSAYVFIRPAHVGPPTAGEIAQVVLAVVLVVVFCVQIVPSLLFNRTRGLWVLRILWFVRLLMWAVTPITALIRFFFSIASLAERPSDSAEEPTPDVNALIEAGEEEGILERSDRDLVRSAVEFGDTLVRELMTPRPEVFAVAAGTTLECFLELLRKQDFSRVPVYADALDNITGIAFAHDLLQISDEEARTRTVASIQHPAVFVPETKRSYELLREMQREKQHMCIVVDEYGSVAGVVTIENLLEEIVGDIRDEHESYVPREEPLREASGTWLVPGSFPADEIGDLIGEPVDFNQKHEAATLGGLVSELEGRIPLPGEIIVLSSSALRIEVVAATKHRVERLRIYPPPGTNGDAHDQTHIE